jgi:hypothetical protein
MKVVFAVISVIFTCFMAHAEASACGDAYTDVREASQYCPKSSFSAVFTPDYQGHYICDCGKKPNLKNRRQKGELYCNSAGTNCLTYDQIKALQQSGRDQDRSSRGRTYPW